MLFQEAADLSYTESKIRLSFVSFNGEEKWKSCCTAAVDCCNRMLGLDEEEKNEVVSDSIDQDYSTALSHNFSSSSLYFCPSTWDGWTCWKNTGSNQVAHTQCPHYIYFETEPPACARKYKANYSITL